jgi:hypothetical protein
MYLFYSEVLLSLCVAIIPRHTAAYVQFWYLFEDSVVVRKKKTGCSIHNHSRTHISTSSFFWNRRLPTRSFSGPNKRDTHRSVIPGLWCGWSRRSTCCVQLALCRCCCDALKSHPSRHISSAFLGTASHSRRTCHSRCFAPRHEFRADGPYCIQEYRHCRDTLRITGLPEKLHYSLFCLGCQLVRKHVIASHCGTQQIISFLQTLVPTALTLRGIPVVRGQVFA